VHGARYVADLFGLRLLHEVVERVESGADEPERVLPPLPRQFFLLTLDNGLQVGAQRYFRARPPDGHWVHAVEPGGCLKPVHLSESRRFREGLNR